METRQYVSGNVITMRLMRREKGSLVALPSSQWVKVEEPINFDGEAFCCLHEIFVVLTLVLFDTFFFSPILLRCEFACILQAAAGVSAAGFGFAG